jgi:hypothetical protein
MLMSNDAALAAQAPHVAWASRFGFGSFLFSLLPYAKLSHWSSWVLVMQASLQHYDLSAALVSLRPSRLQFSSVLQYDLSVLSCVRQITTSELQLNVISWVKCVLSVVLDFFQTNLPVPQTGVH